MHVKAFEGEIARRVKTVLVDGVDVTQIAFEANDDEGWVMVYPNHKDESGLLILDDNSIVGVGSDGSTPAPKSESYKIPGVVEIILDNPITQ